MFDDDQSVIDLLALQEWMDVAQEDGQVLFSVSVRNDNCHFVFRLAFIRLVIASTFQSILSHFKFELLVSYSNKLWDDNRSISPTN